MESFEKGCKNFEEEMHASNNPPILTSGTHLLTQVLTGNYSIYYDHMNYKYNITLARADLLNNTNERHVLKVYVPLPHFHPQHNIFTTLVFPSIPFPFRPRVRLHRPWAQRLQLYESNATPKLYACFEKYSKPGTDPATNMLAPVGSSFDVAFDHFKKFFKLKTGKTWEDRLQKAVPSKDAFIFVPPKNGETTGVMQNDGLSIIDEDKEAAIDLIGSESSDIGACGSVALEVKSRDVCINPISREDSLVDRV